MASVPSAPVALTALAGGPSTSQLAAPNSGTSTTSATNVARPTQAPVQSCSNGAGTNAAPIQPQIMQTSGGQLAGAAPATSRGTYRNPLVEFLLKTWVGNLVGILGLVATCIALVWTLYSGIVSLNITLWSAKNAALDTCLSLRGYAKSSKYCNETIDRGIGPPPTVKRALRHVGLISIPATFTGTIVVTLGVGILTTIYFRPRLVPFHPVVSLARSQPFELRSIWTQRWKYAQAVFSDASYSVTAYTQNTIWTSSFSNEDPTGYNELFDPLDEDCFERRIGLFNSSDDGDSESIETEQCGKDPGRHSIDVAMEMLSDDDQHVVAEHSQIREAPEQFAAAFEIWLFNHPRIPHERDGPLSRASERMTRLSTFQFVDLLTDVHDEVLRREHAAIPGEIVDEHLLPEASFHKQRNDARAKLSKLRDPHFHYLVSDAYDELGRRRFGRTDIHFGNSLSGRALSKKRENISTPMARCVKLVEDLQQLRDRAITTGHSWEIRRLNEILDLTTVQTRDEQTLRDVTDMIPDWAQNPSNRQKLLSLIDRIRAMTLAKLDVTVPLSSTNLAFDVVILDYFARYFQAVKEELSDGLTKQQKHDSLHHTSLNMASDMPNPTESVDASFGGNFTESLELQSHAPETATGALECVEGPVHTIETLDDSIEEHVPLSWFPMGKPGPFAAGVMPEEERHGAPVITSRIINVDGRLSIARDNAEEDDRSHSKKRGGYFRLLRRRGK